MPLPDPDELTPQQKLDLLAAVDLPVEQKTLFLAVDQFANASEDECERAYITLGRELRSDDEDMADFCFWAGVWSCLVETKFVDPGPLKLNFQNCDRVLGELRARGVAADQSPAAAMRFAAKLTVACLTAGAGQD